MSDVKLKIRHAKRGNEKAIDLSNMGLIELPTDLFQLGHLESINLSGNKLSTLRRIEQLPNIREIYATNNNIQSLHPELSDIYGLETLVLLGNPIVNSNPQLAQIQNSEEAVQQALETYFGGGGSSSTAARQAPMQPVAASYSTMGSQKGPSMGVPTVNHMNSRHAAASNSGNSPYGFSAAGQGGTGSMPMSQSLKMNRTGSSNNDRGYLTGTGGVKTGDLNNRMNEFDLDAPTNQPVSSSMRVMNSEYQSAGNTNWLNFGGQGRAPMERPTTAS